MFDFIKSLHLLVLVIVQLIFASIGSAILCMLELLKYVVSQVFLFIDDNINHIVWISFLCWLIWKLYPNQIMDSINKIIVYFQ